MSLEEEISADTAGCCRIARTVSCEVDTHSFLLFDGKQSETRGFYKKCVALNDFEISSFVCAGMPLLIGPTNPYRTHQ